MQYEFFTDCSSLTADEINLIIEDHYTDFSHLDDNTVRIISRAILDHPVARAILHAMQDYGITEPSLQVEQFIKCNWGSLDRVPDIDENLELHFEYVNCGFKGGRCPFHREFCIKKYSFQE